MKPIKILYLTQFSEIGGGETILLSLLEKLNRKLFKPYVIVPKKGQLSEKLQNLKVETHFLNLPPYLIRTFFVPGASPIGLWQLATITQKIKPDLVHINHLTQAVYAGLAAKLLKIPLIATAHGPWDSFYFYQDLITNFFADKILANSKTMAQNLLKRKIISAQKVEVVPFGIDTTKFKPASSYQRPVARKAFGFGENDFVVTIVGRLDPSKDHLTFLKAANLLLGRIENAKFFIVGSRLGDFSGSKNSYTREIKNYLRGKPELAKSVIFGGLVDDMPSVYHATDILVSTSPQESFGLAQKEAMSCAVASVVASTTTTIPPKDRQICQTAKSQSPQGFARKIWLLFKNPDLRTKIGKAARIYVEKNFPLTSYITKVESIYRRLTT